MSDIARPYPNGKEPAIGGQTGGLPYANGKELAHTGNANLAQIEVSGKEKAK